MRRLVLTVTCPDRTGIVAAVTGFIASHGGWVVEAAQHGDLATGQFFQRIEILAESLSFGPDEFGDHFADVADEYGLDWHLSDTDVRKRVVILASREDHCLADLLYRWRSGNLDATSLRSSPTTPICGRWSNGTASSSSTFRWPTGHRAEAFDDIVSHFEAARADTMVLARYMQILPSESASAIPVGSSTSTTASCPRSPAPAPTTRPSNEA